MVKILHNILHDNVNFIYLTIVYSIILQVNNINILFQRNDIDIFKIYSDLYGLLLNYMTLIIKPIFMKGLENMSENFKKIEAILQNNLSYINIEHLDFGFNYRQALTDYPIDKKKLVDIKVKIQVFIKVLCTEMIERIPDNLKLFDSIKYFNVEICMNRSERVNFESLPLELLESTAIDLSILERQYNNLINVPFDINAQHDSEKFWIQLMHYKNSGGELIFFELSRFALSILSLPISNAYVERVFLTMNIVKSKIRNKINLPLLDSILRIKHYFFVRNICCKDLILTKDMCNKFNVNMYDHKQV